MLPVLVAGAFLLRFLTLREIPLPPSGDAAGDLVWLHTYLGHPLPGYTLVEAPPPVYFFLVVWPSTTALGVFGGIQFMMALVPALYVIPGFYLLRWGGLDRPAAFTGAALLGTSSAFSELVTWNSAFNATGILFLLACLAFVVRGRSQPTTVNLVAAAVFFSLVAGSHIVSFLYLVATLGAYAVLIVLLSPGRWRAPLRYLGLVVLLGTVLSLLYLPDYYSNFTITANVGPPSTGTSWQELEFVYSQFVGFPWGTNSPLPPVGTTALVILADMILTVLALPLVWDDPRNRELAMLSSALLVAAILIAALDPGNAIRAVYFLPIPFVIAGVAWVARRFGDPPAPEAGWGLARALGRRWANARPVHRRAILATAAVVFVAVNIVVSETAMAQSEQFYLQLTPEKVRALEWISAHTPANASFYDAADLQTWLLGYAHRLAFASDPLSSKVTDVSYDRAFDANLIDLGAYVLGNSRFFVTSNAPGVYNTPGVYVRTQDFWAPLWLADSDTTVVRAEIGGAAQNLTLRYGQAIDVTGSVEPNGTVVMLTELSFPSARTTVLETVELTASQVEIGFALTQGTILSVTLDFRTPPSGYYYDYAPFTSMEPGGELVQSLEIPFTGTISLDVSGEGLTTVTSTEPSGWSTLNVTFPSAIAFTLRGYAGVPGAAPFFANTLTLTRSLGIDYVVVSSQTDYPLFERYFALSSQGYLPVPEVFVDNDLYVLQLN